MYGMARGFLHLLGMLSVHRLIRNDHFSLVVLGGSHDFSIG
jgi:hypothetical protein